MSFHKDTLTIYDVARRAGVSAATVSRVINDKGNVKASTRDKVLAAVRETGFSPNQIARTLPMRTSRTVGLVAESLLAPYFSCFSHELDCACAERGYALNIGLTGSDRNKPQKEIRVLRDFVKRQVDGFIVLGGRSNFSKVSPSFRKEVEDICRQLPLVFINCGYSFKESSHVRTDEGEAFGKIMDHLLELGHRKIGLITGAQEKWTNDVKRSVYREKLEKASLSVEEGFIRSGIYTVESGRENSRSLLGEHRDVTALACTNDVLAVGALHGALSLGLSVPGDISVTGFDDIDMARYALPGITTISQNYRELAGEALGIIVERSEGERSPRQVCLRGELIVRGSTGVCKSP